MPALARFWLLSFFVLLYFADPLQAFEVPLFGLYETSIDYHELSGADHPYPEPFYGVELEALFFSPSGRRVVWWGFYDGNGQGGQAGNIWKIRFMPDELGEWTFQWKFTDGSLGGNGTFAAVDNSRHPKKPGPLKHDPNIHQWLMTADGDRHVFLNMYKTSFLTPNYFVDPKSHLDHLVKYGFDVQFISGLNGFQYVDAEKNDRNPFPFMDTINYVPRLQGWHFAENGLFRELYERNLYVYDFIGFYGGNKIYDLHRKPISFQNKVIKYWLLRTAPYYMFLYSVGFELPEYVVTPSWPVERAKFIKEIDPWDHLVTAHELRQWNYGCSSEIDFSALQNDDHFHERGLMVWNSPSKPHPHCNECIWNAKWQKQGTEASHRKDLWDGITAGMSNSFIAKDNEIGLMAFKNANDFLKSGVKWWTMKPHDELIQKGDAYALANPGSEYIIYSHSGRTFTLRLAAGSYHWRWFSPASGSYFEWSILPGDAIVQFDKPDENDWVLQIKQIDNN